MRRDTRPPWLPKSWNGVGAAGACLVLLAVLVGACGRDGQPDRLVVFAATSLRDAFTTMSGPFEGAHPGVKVQFNFAGTQQLRTQLEHGATPDVFASADARHMDALVAARLLFDPVIFAENEPVVVVSTEAAGLVQSFEDLPKADRVVLGTADVPIGRYTNQMLAKADATLGPGFRARVEAKVISRELNVRQVLAKVSLGEAQAGIVYRTDARSAGARVTTVAIPPELNVTASYPIAVAVGAPNPDLARAWIDFVLSDAGQRLLRAAGFTTPDTAGPP